MPDYTPPRPTNVHDKILAVTLVYAVFASLWILLSDTWVQLLFKDPAQIMLAGLFKGGLFVLVTALLLYGTMRRWINCNPAPKPVQAGCHWLNWPFITLVAVIVTLTSAAAFHVWTSHKATYTASLQAVAEELAWIGFVGLSVLCLSAAGFYLLRQSQQLALAQAVQQSQAERLEARHLLTAIADCSNDAIFAKDTEGHFILFNQAASQFVGKPVEKILGHDDHAIFPPDQAEMLIDIGHKVIAENCIHTQEEVLSTPDGERIFLATKGPLRDAHGKVIGLFGISRDITERRQAEKALQLSELSYCSLFENMINGFAHCLMLYEDGKPWDFIYLHVNQAFEAQTGLRDVAGRKASEAIPGIREADPGLIEIYSRVALNGRPERFETYVTALRMWFSIAVYSPQREHFVAVFDVITERKNAELDLHRQANELTQRNAELERFNRAMVGRELDMIALKQQINALSRELGRKPPYPLAFLDTEAADKVP